MQTEQYRIADSQDEAFAGASYPGARVESTLRSDLPVPLVEDLAAALDAAGWATQATHPATGDLTFAFGPAFDSTPADPLRVLGDPRNPVFASATRIGAVINGVYYVWYNPWQEAPTAYTGVTWVAGAITSAASLSAMFAAINGASGYYVTGTDVLGDGQTVAHLEAVVPGPAANDWQIGGDSRVGGDPVGYWSTGGFMSNGGYTMRASTWYGYLDCRIDGRFISGQIRVAFEFTASAGGDSPVMSVQAPAFGGGDWTIIANQFQFFLRHPTAGGLFAVLPYVDQANAHGVTYAAMMAETGGGDFEWNSFSYAAANGGLKACLNPYVGTRPGLYMSRGAHPYVSGPLLDSQAHGQAVLESAYIGAPPSDGAADTTGQARIAGLVWDAIIVRDDFPLLSEGVFGSLIHRCVMRNAGGYYRPVGSLWIATRAAAA